MFVFYLMLDTTTSKPAATSPPCFLRTRRRERAACPSCFLRHIYDPFQTVVSEFRHNLSVVLCFAVSQLLVFVFPVGVQLLALLVPTLISYLLDENAISSAPQVSRSLHDFALQNLMRIGPLYPAAFKTVIGAAPELKTRLESAVRANQASSKAKAAARQAQPAVQAAPTIKLKTSFF